MNEFVAMYEKNKFEVWSTTRLPFEPKFIAQKEMKLAIIKQLKALTGGHYLHAVHTSPELNHHESDIDNILAYNVGYDAFSNLQLKGLCFERSFKKPPICQNITYPHHSLYRLLNEESYHTNWVQDKKLAEYNAVHLEKLNANTRSYEIWYHFKDTPISIYTNETYPYYGLEISIHAPVEFQYLPIGIIKPLLDGITATLHYHHEPNEIDEIISYFKLTLDVPRDNIKTYLLDDDFALLGRKKLVTRTMQLNPDDHKIVCLVLHYDHDSEAGYQLDCSIYGLKMT